MRWDAPQVRELIDLALREDIRDGDVTTLACVPSDAPASGYFLARQDLTLAGTQLLPLIYVHEDIQILASDGQSLRNDERFARVSGSAQRLLTLERTALNLLQRACGVATRTARFERAIEGTGCTLLDTRKTMPGMRMLDKLAVRAGGGTNHRLGLFDAILIKNNHISAAGGVRQAIERCSASELPVEVEVRTFEELSEALDCGSHHLLLDNFTPEQVAIAVKQINGRAKVEVSGNVILETIRKYAEAGADFVSVGALTHSAQAADISFRLE